MSAFEEYLPRAGEFDPLAGELPAGGTSATTPTAGRIHDERAAGTEAVLRILTLNEVLSYQAPVGAYLVGDGVVELGGDSLLFGPPGGFKGFAVGQLMAAGAWGHGSWLGFPVNSKFSSLWLNCENRRRRLRDQFAGMLLPPDAADHIFVTDIPSVWNLADPRLAGPIRQTIVERNIKLLIVDTVSCLTEDEFAKHFAAFFVALNQMLHGLEPRPAVLLLHHSRKPKEGDKGARGLLNLISGHQTLQRRARSICYLGRVTDDFDEKRLAAVWLKVSDNGPAEGTKTALQLGQDNLLHPIEGFDWNEWQAGSPGGTRREAKVREEHLRELFADGRKWLLPRQAAEQLQALASVGRSAAYDALKVIGGRFSALIIRDPETHCISLKGAEPEGEE